MIRQEFAYAAPGSVGEAVELLSTGAGGRALAGGQSLLVDMKVGDATPTRLVDLRRISRLNGIERSPAGTLRIGAMTTLADIAASADVRAVHPPLADAASAVGDPQVRNRATIGGNLAGRERPTDLPAVALSGMARLQLTGPDGDRTATAEEYFAADGQGDLIVSVEFPQLDERELAVFNRIADRTTRHPLCAVGIWARLADDGGMSACRIGVAGATRRPTRLPAVEAALAHTLPTSAAIRRAVEAVPAGEFVDDQTASADYRAHVTSILLARSFAQILAE